MAFLENRYSWHTEKKSPDVFRIVCLGDSLTFGCGVAPYNTLPSQLATLLNRSLWEPVIEVVNAGICGFSLYDEWNFYCHHVNRFNPDLLLVILCPNDAELFSVQRNYENHVKACWDEQGNHLPYFRKAIARVGKQVSALGLPCLIAFYDISGEQDAEKYASVTKDICDQNGLSFISLAAEFTGEYSGRNNPGMNVSSVDRHPSGLAHQVAAQRLARHLTHNSFIPAGSPGAREEELYRTVLRVGTFLNDNGLQPELCISRMREILEAKRGGRARAALDPALLMEESEFSQLESSLASAMENSVTAVFLAGFSERLKWNSTQYYQDMEGIQRSILSIEKNMFVLEENFLDPSLPYYPACKKDEGGDFSTIPSRMALMLETVSMIKSNYVTIQQTPSGTVTPAILTIQENSAREITRAAATLQTFLDMLDSKLQIAKGLFDRFCTLFNASKDRLLDSAVSSTFVLISHELSTLINRLQNAVTGLQLHEIKPLSSAAAKRVPFTTFTATVRCSSTIVPNMIITVESIVPHRQLLREMQYVINDGQSHVYSFAFPLVTLGRFCVYLTSIEETTIEGIQLYNNDSRVISYSDISRKAEFNLPVALIPV
jgi:lysophospholipase L1-like esterase